MIRPTAGHAELFGERVHSGATDLWRRVGHLVEIGDRLPGTHRPREPRHRPSPGRDARRVRRGSGHRAAGTRAVRGSAGRHAVARQPAAAGARPCAAAVAGAARPRRAGQRAGSGWRDRDPRAAPRPRSRARASRSSCRATSSARSIGWRRGSGSSIAAGWSRSWTRRAGGASRSPARGGGPGSRACRGALRGGGLLAAAARGHGRTSVLELREPRALEAPDEVATPAGRGGDAADPPRARPRVTRGSLHPLDRLTTAGSGRERFRRCRAHRDAEGAALARPVGRGRRVLACAAGHGPVHGHPQGPRTGPGAGTAGREGAAHRGDRRLAHVPQPARPGGSRRRGGPVRLPYGLGLRTRVRGQDRSWTARQSDVAEHDRPRQGGRRGDLGARDHCMGPPPRTRHRRPRRTFPAGHHPMGRRP